MGKRAAGPPEIPRGVTNLVRAAFVVVPALLVGAYCDAIGMGENSRLITMFSIGIALAVSEGAWQAIYRENRHDSTDSVTDEVVDADDRIADSSTESAS